jgi:hypothetical protein
MCFSLPRGGRGGLPPAKKVYLSAVWKQIECALLIYHIHYDSELHRIEVLTEEDALKILVPLFDCDEDDDGINDIGLEWDELAVEEGGLDLLEHAIDNNPKDTDWIPPEMRKRVRDRSEGMSAVLDLRHERVSVVPVSRI